MVFRAALVLGRLCGCLVQGEGGLSNNAVDEWPYVTPTFCNKSNVDGLPVDATDIFVASWPKSGTNWMVQLMHSVKIKADAKQVEEDSRRDLRDLVPYMEADPDVDHAALSKPRLYQFHLRYDDIPKGTKVIYIMRDMPSVAKSFWKYVKQFEAVFGEGQTVGDTAQTMMDGLLYYGSWEEHIKSYWDHRHNPDMLLVKYEDMLTNIKGTIGTVAKFMGITLDSAEFARVEAQVSFASMKKNAKRIAGAEWARRVSGIAVDPEYTLMDTGKNAAAGTFTPEMLAKMDKYWMEKAKPILGGAASYAELTLTAVPRHGGEL